jgi:hypothetical protein
MHTSEVREVVGIVAPEVGKELLIFIESQKFADDLDSDYFRVGERWGGSAASDGSLFEAVVNMRQKTATMKVLRSIRRRPPLRLYGAIGQHRA